MSARGLVLATCLVAQSSSGDASDVEFEKRIRPVLARHCYECHSNRAKRLRGGLRLDVPGGWLRGGESGPAVVPGDPEASRLLRALGHDDPDLRMPPDGKLPDRVIADFERWIRIGAPAPEPRVEGAVPPAPEATAAADWWSLRPIREPPVPPVRDREWPRNEIDRFILARLESAGLRPVEDADPAALLRRAYFALTGLPPPPAEVERFLATPSPGEFERVVDRLLGSHHFGERWGRHWLDVARYADSTGGGRTRALENAWRYRDYVVASFNRDRPFNEFVAEQIAGDLLPAASLEERRARLTATGFLVLGPNNYENQDKELLRMEVVDEQIGTVGRAFLALTLDCARCHDHKFDPVPTRDYYALAGIFRSTKSLTPGNVSGFVQQPLPLPPQEERRAAAHAGRETELRRRLEEARKEVSGFEKELKKLAGAGDLSRGIVVDDEAATIEGSWKRSTAVPGFVGSGYLHDENAGKGQKAVTFTPELPAGGLYEVRLAYSAGTNREPATPIAVVHADGTTRRTLDQREAPPIGGLLVSLGRFRFLEGRRGSVRVSNEGTMAHVIADAVQFIPVAELERSRAPSPERAARLEEVTRALETARRAAGAAKRDLEEHARRAPPRALVMSVQEEEKAEDCPVHIRGEIRNLGEPVPRGFLGAVAPRLPGPASHEGSGRRELAAWLTSPENPLTSRVLVNRVWYTVFGAGLVRTVDNFGRTGEPPSHPELLDFLASRFMARGWSVKTLIRELVLSRVFRLGSRRDPAGLAADPENRLLWRRNPVRLDAESIRDALLLVSGELDLRAGGPSIEPGPDGKISSKIEYGYRFTSRRRSVYVPVFRNRLLDLFEVFDFADPNLATGRRTVSTVATQALYLLNSEFVLDRSRAAAERLLEAGEIDDSRRLELLYLGALGRRPGAGERRAALEYLASEAASGEDGAEDGSDRLAVWSGLCQAVLASVDFRHVR